VTAAVTRPASSAGSGQVTQLGAIRSEWIKLRSLRSTWYGLLATFAIVAGLGSLFTALRAHHFDHGFADFDPIAVSLRGAFLAQLAIGVLGVLVISGEYTTGMIRASLAAIPHRTPVLVAKTAVFGVLALVVCTASTFSAFLIGQQALATTHRQAGLGTPHAVEAIVGTALYLTLIGLLAVGLGFLLRTTAGAIATLVGIVLVLPLLASALPDPYATDVRKYLPLSAVDQLMSAARPDPSLLAPWTGLGITALYAAAALLAGFVVLKRRDA
jgi:ABC-type transport system involved in multi-copper enzyme maturation permease subunit